MWQCRVAALFLLLTAPAPVRIYHYSWWSDNPQPYLKAVKQASPATPPRLAAGETVRAGIVTHHFLASGLMVRFFDTLRAESSPEAIILIGPNHFHHGSANISFSSLPWKTPFGVVETDRRIVQQLKAATGLREDPEAFTGEHSVGVLVPFLKYYFSHIRVVPILVDVNAQENRLKELRALLAELLANPKLLVLLSMDFSHDSTAAIADTRDERAREIISALDASKVRELQVDCRKGLWLLIAALGDQGEVKVHISEHTNSARLTGNPRQPDVTSYFTVYFIR
jgi:MEMO1 family protein